MIWVFRFVYVLSLILSNLIFWFIFMLLSSQESGPRFLFLCFINWGIDIQQFEYHPDRFYYKSMDAHKVHKSVHIGQNVPCMILLLFLFFFLILLVLLSKSKSETPFFRLGLNYKWNMLFVWWAQCKIK